MIASHDKIGNGSTILRLLLPETETKDIPQENLQGHELFLNQNLLLRRGEKEYQKIFTRNIAGMQHITDTHHNNFGYPQFMPAQDDSFDMTGKPDAILNVFPAKIELKQDLPNPRGVDDKDPFNNNDYDVLQQSLDRLLTTSGINGVLSKMVVFAITGIRCYVLLFRRDFNGKKLNEMIEIFKVSEDVVKYVWKYLSYCGSNHENISEHYYLRDASPLFKTIRACGYPPEYCRIRLIGCSTSRVYGVKFPVPGYPIRILTIPCPYDLSIKVSSDQSRMSNEIKCLDEIAEKIPRLKEGFSSDSDYGKFEFYYLGNFQNGVLTMINENPEQGFQINETNPFGERAWWKPRLPENQDQTILMKCGRKRKPNQNNITQVVRDVEVCLYFIHGAGLVHTDLRKKNIVKFDDHWQVIDFDHACKVGTCTVLSRQGGQYQCAGSYLNARQDPTNLTQSLQHHWQTIDDYQMLHNLIFSILSERKTERTSLVDEFNQFSIGSSKKSSSSSSTTTQTNPGRNIFLTMSSFLMYISGLKSVLPR